MVGFQDDRVGLDCAALDSASGPATRTATPFTPSSSMPSPRMPSSPSMPRSPSTTSPSLMPRSSLPDGPSQRSSSMPPSIRGLPAPSIIDVIPEQPGGSTTYADYTALGDVESRWMIPGRGCPPLPRGPRSPLVSARRPRRRLSLSLDTFALRPDQAAGTPHGPFCKGAGGVRPLSQPATKTLQRSPFIRHQARVPERAAPPH